MAVAQSTVWEIRTTGLATNGGGFNVGSTGIDYSQQNSPQIAVTDAVTAGTTTITSATASFGTDVVGNNIYVVGGTGAIVGDWYQVATRVNSTTITVDRSIGLTAGTGATLNLGGALNNPTLATPNVNNTVWIASGTYGGSTTVTFNKSGSSSAPVFWIGYKTTRADADLSIADMPHFTTATNSISVFTLNAASYNLFRNIRGSSTAATPGMIWSNATTQSVSPTWMNCFAEGGTYAWDAGTATSTSFSGASYLSCGARLCTVAGYRAAVIGSSFFKNCVSYQCLDGFSLGNAGTVSAAFMDNCISYENTNNGYFMPVTTAAGALVSMVNCVSAFNGQAGIRFNQTSGTFTSTSKFTNNIFYGNGTYNVHSVTVGRFDGMSPYIFMTNAVGGAGIANMLNFRTGENLITLTADPFTNTVTDDFTVNSVSGGGALLRGTGYPTSFPFGFTPDYADVGASQHMDSGGGGGGETSYIG